MPSVRILGGGVAALVTITFLSFFLVTQQETTSSEDHVAAPAAAAQQETVALPEETGNVGLIGSTGTSMALVLALGVFAAAMVAGGRTATHRS